MLLFHLNVLLGFGILQQVNTFSFSNVSFGRTSTTYTQSGSSSKSSISSSSSSYLSSLESEPINNENSNVSEQKDTPSTVPQVDHTMNESKLVALGKQFDSYERRFDYLSLLQQNPNHPIPPPSSSWVRVNKLSNNVVQFLYTTRGMDVEDARIEVKNPCVQSYQRHPARSQNTFGLDYYFEVQTESGVPLVEDADTNIIHDESKVIEQKVSWDGKRLIMDITKQSNNDGIDDQHKEPPTITHIEKFLSFLEGDGIDGNNVFLIVESVFYPFGDQEDIRSITCLEVFKPLYNIENLPNDIAVDAQSTTVLKSELEQVDECIENIKIRTTLISKGAEAYYVILDGEADNDLSRGILALLSSMIGKLDAKDVLNINSSTVVNELMLQDVLDQEKVLCLENVVKMTQNQVRKLL
mmetsp:Transcript_25916/g.31949  ORF Transcript_25916/g.31949 Transcript_25916/m.31949 type:complete len:411 (+) Transcript_25916:168-1400(+)